MSVYFPQYTTSSKVVFDPPKTTIAPTYASSVVTQRYFIPSDAYRSLQYSNNNSRPPEVITTSQFTTPSVVPSTNEFLRRKQNHFGDNSLGLDSKLGNTALKPVHIADRFHKNHEPMKIAILGDGPVAFALALVLYNATFGINKGANHQIFMYPNKGGDARTESASQLLSASSITFLQSLGMSNVSTSITYGQLRDQLRQLVDSKKDIPYYVDRTLQKGELIRLSTLMDYIFIADGDMGGLVQELGFERKLLVAPRPLSLGNIPVETKKEVPTVKVVQAEPKPQEAAQPNKVTSQLPLATTPGPMGSTITLKSTLSPLSIRNMNFIDIAISETNVKIQEKETAKLTADGPQKSTLDIDIKQLKYDLDVLIKEKKRQAQIDTLDNKVIEKKTPLTDQEMQLLTTLKTEKNALEDELQNNSKVGGATLGARTVAVWQWDSETKFDGKEKNKTQDRAKVLGNRLIVQLLLGEDIENKGVQEAIWAAASKLYGLENIKPTLTSLPPQHLYQWNRLTKPANRSYVVAVGDFTSQAGTTSYKSMNSNLAEVAWFNNNVRFSVANQPAFDPEKYVRFVQNHDKNLLQHSRISILDLEETLDCVKTKTIGTEQEKIQECATKPLKK